MFTAVPKKLHRTSSSCSPSKPRTEDLAADLEGRLPEAAVLVLLPTHAALRKLLRVRAVPARGDVVEECVLVRGEVA